MGRARTAAATTARNLETPARELILEVTAEPRKHPGPNPPPEPRAADRIREALQRWLEEDM